MNYFGVVEVEHKASSEEINIQEVASAEPEKYDFIVNFVNGIQNLGDKPIWISINDLQWRELKPNNTILQNVNLSIETIQVRSEFGLVPFSMTGVRL